MRLRRSRLFRSVRFLGALSLAVAAGSLPAQPQPSALDLDGHPFDPLASSGKAVVLVFVRSDCPISARYAPAIQRLSAEYARDAKFYLVFPDKEAKASELRKYLHEFGYTLPALRDPARALVKLAHAHVTPEAAVFDRKGVLLYHGRIDNLYEDVARPRPRATTHELDDALQAALHGAPLLAKETPAVGCYISDLP